MHVYGMIKYMNSTTILYSNYFLKRGKKENVKEERFIYLGS